MNNFIVSARKYRPDSFETVVGQLNITQTLKNAIKNNHLAQAFLFCGPRGVGKTTTARILAKTINCTNISENTEACNECESCRSFNSGQSLNIYELDAASNNSVDDIRSLVEQVRYPPQGGRYKVYIIDEVHMLSASAFNAFLKTLEEPPSYAIFILATTEKHKIIPTILSRCQIFDFSRISIDAIADHLKVIAVKEGVEAEEDALHVIAQKADGALRDALSMFDQQVSFAGNHLTYKSVIENLNVLDYDYYFRVTNEILNGNISGVLLILNDILNYGFDGHNFITGLSSHFRDLLVCKDEITLKLMEVSPNVKEKYKLQSRQCTQQHLLELLDIANKCDMNYRSAKHQRLHVELALMKMCVLFANSDVSRHLADKKKVDAENVTVKTHYEKQEPSNEKIAVANEPPSPKIASQPPTTGSESPNLKPQTSNPKSPSPRTSISITESLKATQPTTGNKETTAPKDAPKPQSGGGASFSKEELEKVWNEFTLKLQQDGRITLFAAFTKRQPELKENSIIEFAIDSSAIEKDITDIKQDLLGFLRQRLNNGAITLQTSIAREATTSKTPYTPKEKFDYLAAKNPAMHELKKRMDLEIDF